MTGVPTVERVVVPFHRRSSPRQGVTALLVAHVTALGHALEMKSRAVDRALAVAPVTKAGTRVIATPMHAHRVPVRDAPTTGPVLDLAPMAHRGRLDLLGLVRRLPVVAVATRHRGVRKMAVVHVRATHAIRFVTRHRVDGSIVGPRNGSTAGPAVDQKGATPRARSTRSWKRVTVLVTTVDSRAGAALRERVRSIFRAPDAPWTTPRARATDRHPCRNG